MAPMSLKPSEAVEGGDFPRGVLDITKAVYQIFEYKDKAGNAVVGRDKKPAKTMAGILTLTNEGGTDFEQVYSVGDPSRFKVLDGGRQLDGTMRANCNFYRLMTELVNKGLDESKLGDSITDLVGLKAEWDAVQLDGMDREMVLPLEIIKAPWEAEKGGKSTKAKAAPKKAVKEEESAVSAEAIKKLVDIIDGLVEDEIDVARQAVSMSVFSTQEDEDVKSAMMSLVFEGGAGLEVALADKGISLAGESYTRV